MRKVVKLVRSLLLQRMHRGGNPSLVVSPLVSRGAIATIVVSVGLTAAVHLTLLMCVVIYWQTRVADS